MTNTSIDWQPFCDKWLGAWTGNRPDLLIAFYTGDASYLDPAFPAGLKGHVQLLPYFEKLLSRNPDWRWEAVEIFNTVNGFTLKWRTTIPIKGFVLVLYGLDIAEMQGQLISRNEVYFDRLKWMELMK